jgi:uncharacterized protein YbbC (DUF1343 family)
VLISSRIKLPILIVLIIGMIIIPSSALEAGRLSHPTRPSHYVPPSDSDNARYSSPAKPSDESYRQETASVQPENARILLGIDVLASRNFREIAGKRVGLLTNQAGVDSRGVSTIDILRRAPNVRLVALFGPEHGVYGDAKANVNVADSIDPRTGLPVYSLFGKYRRPSPEMLARIDVMVIDLQDVGVRSYTYISAMKYVIEECFKAGKEVVVLDRPNPLGGYKADGPMMDAALNSYVGAYNVPYVYGLTIGELALMARGTPGWLAVTESQRARGRLTVIPMSGWKRSMRWSDTGLTWKWTSPYIQNLDAAYGYSMTGLGCMMGGFTHGLDSSYPFRVLRYQGRTSEEVRAALVAENIQGLDYRIVTITQPDGKVVRGVFVAIADWNAWRPTELNFHLMKIAAKWSREAGRPNPFASAGEDQALLFNKHTGSLQLWQALTRQGENADINGLFEKWRRDATAFQSQSSRFWIYR